MTPKIYGRSLIQDVINESGALGASLAMSYKTTMTVEEAEQFHKDEYQLFPLPDDLVKTTYEERKALQRERQVVKKDRQLDRKQKRKDKRSQAY